MAASGRLVVVSLFVVLLTPAQLALAGSTPDGTQTFIYPAPNLRTRAADLRVQLDRLLGEHAFLTTEALRTGVLGGADFAAAGGALEANTSDLEALITRVYGTEGGRAFGRLWRDHIGYMVDYTVAVSQSDSGARDRAMRGLQAYRIAFSRFMARINPHLSETAVSRLLSEHITQLEQLAAYSGKDYARSYASARHAYAHMFAVGDAFAFAMARQFPRNFPGLATARSPALNLRVTLDRLLGEHTFLSVEAMRAGVAGGPDFAAARSALSANGRDLSTAIGSVYGRAAGRQFQPLWDAHVGYYLDYITAMAAGDDSARNAANAALRSYPRTLATFLGRANPQLSTNDFEQLVAQHAEHMLRQVDAYAAKDYSTAYGGAREAYAHILALSDALAFAIAAQFPAVFPALPATDTVVVTGSSQPQLCRLSSRR
jgi:hypothetical protein